MRTGTVGLRLCGRFGIQQNAKSIAE